jgi:hypothetical protein
MRNFNAKRFFIILALLVGIGSVIFYFWHRKKKKEKLAEDAGNPVAATDTSQFPLKVGSRGNYVLRLQAYMNRMVDAFNSVVGKNGTAIMNGTIMTEKILPPLAEDGIFGPETLAMLNRCFSLSEVSKEFFESKKM